MNLILNCKLVKFQNTNPFIRFNTLIIIIPTVNQTKITTNISPNDQNVTHTLFQINIYARNSKQYKYPAGANGTILRLLQIAMDIIVIEKALKNSNNNNNFRK